MNIALLALYERSLRLETRSWVPLVVRLLLLGWLLLQLLIIGTQSRLGWFGAPGLYFFSNIAWLNFVFLTLGGMGYFAAAIAEEKEEMTLGLLRMTGLNPLAILLGKSTARLTGAMLLMLTQVPFTLLAVTLGGISVMQIVTSYAVLLAYLFLLSNLALIWSVVFQRIATAAAMTALCLFFFLAVPHLMLGLLSEVEVRDALGGTEHGFGWLLNTGCLWLVKASPIMRLVDTLKTGSTPVLLNFQVVSNLVAGAIFFGVAWLVFDRCTREQKDASPTRTIGMRLHALVRRGRVPPRVVGARVLTWKESALFQSGVAGFALWFLGLGALYFVVFICPALFFPTDVIITQGYVGGSMMVMALILLGLLSVRSAATVFLEEVQWKTLSCLMILPISVRELIWRKVWGHLIGLVPILCFFLLGACIYPHGLFEAVEDIFHGDGFSFLCFGITQFILFLHLVAYLSLVVKRWAVALAFVIHYFGGSMCMLCVSMLSVFARFGHGSAFFWLGMLLALGVTGGLIILLQFGIGSRLQRVAAEE